MVDWILQHVLELALTCVTGVFGIAYRKIAIKVNEQEAMREGMLAILHDRIYQSCTYHLSQGTIDVQGLKNIEYLYKSYHDLGGNGTGTELYTRVTKLKLEEEKR